MSDEDAIMESNVPTDKDTEPLLDANKRRRRRSVACCFCIFLLGTIAVAIAILLSYFLQFNHGTGAKTLKVMALNTWGMPAWLTNWSKDKTVRIKAIGEHIQKEEFDVYLLEELWMRPDHSTIKSLLPQGKSQVMESPESAGEGRVRWLKAVGEFVLVDEILCQVEGDSGNFTVASTVNGYIEEHLVAEGMTSTPGTNLYKILVGKYVMTEVGQLAVHDMCDGRVLPTDCSGLAIISKFPFKEIEFYAYSWHGNFWNFDGEYEARKGVGRVRIEPYKGMTVDVFVTHTAASDYNKWYREKQVGELVEHVQKSDADFVILGGDFNVDPRMEETSYKAIEKVMVNSIEEFFKTLAAWLLNEYRATYGNPNNTYSNNYDPVFYDYIFHKAKGKNMIWTDLFTVPFLKTANPSSLQAGLNNTSLHVTNLAEISFSDHEAVTSHLLLWKYSKPDEDEPFPLQGPHKSTGQK